MYVKDLVDALLIAAEIDKASNKIINISGDIPISVLDITKHISSISSRDVEIEHVAPRPGDVRDSLGATELAKQILNFTPKVSFEEGLGKTYEWYQSQA